MIRLALVGANGRMGTDIIRLLADDDRFELVAAITTAADPDCGRTLCVGDSTVVLKDELTAACDVLVDFSTPAGTMQYLDHCSRTGTPMIVGPTGYDDAELDRIAQAATRTAILQASNFSLGINLLVRLVATVAKQLGDVDIEIIEHHHRNKVDAPSGTAITLADAIVNATDRSADRRVIHGRDGHTGPRPDGEIAIHAVRMGALAGQHEVHFATDDETVTLRHTAHSRTALSRGALHAAAWIHNKPPGRYTMRDVLT